MAKSKAKQTKRIVKTVTKIDSINADKTEILPESQVTEEIIELEEASDPADGIPTEDTKIAPENKEIFERKYMFPQLALAYQKLRRTYGVLPEEGQYKEFKQKIDPSIPIKKVITTIVRIRTLFNKEQTLGEYIYYYANLTGYQKHYIEGQLQTYPAAEATGVPFHMDRTISLAPEYKNGKFSGYTDKGEHRVYDRKFSKGAVEDIIKEGSPEEGTRINLLTVDSSDERSGYTEEEFSTVKFNRLVFRNTNKKNGTEIETEDKL